MQIDEVNVRMADFWPRREVGINEASHWIARLSKHMLFRRYLFWKNKLNLPRNSKVIEVGCGYGKFSLLLGLIGEKTTLLDYNKEKISLALKIHRCFNLEPQCEIGDLIDLSMKLNGQYDVVCSFGVLEHFSGKYRLLAFQASSRFLRPGGMLFFSVPNSSGLFYRLAFGLRKIFCKSKTFYEKAFSRSELQSFVNNSGIKALEIQGIDSLKNDWLYWGLGNIKSIIRKVLRKKIFAYKLDDLPLSALDFTGSNIKDTRNYLDKQFSSSLLFVGQKV